MTPQRTLQVRREVLVVLVSTTVEMIILPRLVNNYSYQIYINSQMETEEWEKEENQ